MGTRAEEARAALAAEQGRSFKLEAQVAELRQALSRTSDLERELEVRPYTGGLANFDVFAYL